ncbi:dihydrofolate reductase [Labrys monachus]|uniref:Dihydrofolate reductase n=1 Tax=Labrys monachus TaxID=217067 RepID=A0ABU0FKV9_9HYPH|nr:dihydrofolate reductase [Labrys monachus]MDQ0395225.1 dihydrofolate reductase [Labrys monachus]
MSIAVVMVAAMARNRAIGARNGLPWRMRSDMKHFKAATMGKPMLMGRKTYESIGRPLPGRRTIVVTHDRDFAPEGVETVASLEEGLRRGRAVAAEMGADALVIAGGAAVYGQAMPVADRLILTELALDAEGDAFFPAVSDQEWREVSRIVHPRGEGDDAAFEVVVWERRR